MGLEKIIKKVLLEQYSSFPIRLSGSYKVPDKIMSRGDALHSFDKRRSDDFGGYMLRGGPIPSKWSSYVTLNQGKGVNEVLEELVKKGMKPDVTDINITVNNDFSVDWEVTIDESKDGKAYYGVASRGSAGGGADNRANGQIPKLKSKNPEYCNWEDVLDLDITKPIKIRQFFLKYTKCGEGEGNEIDTPEEKDLEKFFSKWESGIYKLDTDKEWTYKLTDDKKWEGKKGSDDFISLENGLPDYKYEEALDNLRDAELVTTESLRNKIKTILKEETSLQAKLLKKLQTNGLKKTIGSVGGKENFKKIMNKYDYYTQDILQEILNYELNELRDESEDWGLGEMVELNQLNSIKELKIVNLVKVNNITITVDIISNDNRKDFDDIISELRYKLQKNWNDKILLLEGEIWNTSDYGPGVNW